MVVVDDLFVPFSLLFLGIANGLRECRFVSSVVRGSISLIWSSVAPKDLPRADWSSFLLLALFSLSVHQLSTIITGRINYQDAAEADASAADAVAADDATEEEEDDEEADN